MSASVSPGQKGLSANLDPQPRRHASYFSIESQSAVCEAWGLVMYFVFLRSAMKAFIDSQLSSMVFVSP